MQVGSYPLWSYPEIHIGGIGPDSENGPSDEPQWTIEGSMDEVQNNADVREVYLGEEA